MAPFSGVRFFSGFGFEKEQGLFEPFLPAVSAGFTLAGFSYGAIEAFEYALSTPERIERLVLLSPAFFQNRPENFKRQQLMGFKKDAARYFEQFYAACDVPTEMIAPFKAPGDAAALKRLLNYRWQSDAMGRLSERGTEVVVYLGGRDRIIDARAAATFFSRLCEVYYLKNAGHFLQEVHDE